MMGHASVHAFVVFALLGLTTAHAGPVPWKRGDPERFVYRAIHGGMAAPDVDRTTWELRLSAVGATLTSVIELGKECPPRAAGEKRDVFGDCFETHSLKALAKMRWTEMRRTVREGTWTHTAREARVDFADGANGALRCRRAVVQARPRGTIPLGPWGTNSKIEDCVSKIRWSRGPATAIKGWACAMVDEKGGPAASMDVFFADKGAVEHLYENSDCAGQEGTLRVGDE